MFDKISTAHFRFVYYETKGDESSPENKQAQYDEQMNFIVKNPHE